MKYESSIRSMKSSMNVCIWYKSDISLWFCFKNHGSIDENIVRNYDREEIKTEIAKLCFVLMTYNCLL